MQQRCRLGDVVCVGRGTHHGVHQSTVQVHADVCLHSKMPLVAFLGLVHLGVTSAGGVLGRTGRLDDRGIHNRALANLNALILQQQIDCLKCVVGDAVPLKQMAKVQDRGFIRNAAARERQLGKLAHRGDVIQRFFHTGVRQREPQLHEVNTQHRLQRIRPTSVARLGVVRFDQVSKHLPGHRALHLRKKLLASRLFTLAGVLCLGKTQLAHRGVPDRADIDNHYSDRFDGLVQTLLKWRQ